MSSSPLISICIPTFNRAEYLKKLLASIQTQYCNISYEVRVQDNASTDKTESVFREIAGDLENWHYEKNAQNIGGKNNIRLCTEKAKGEYIYIVGDDDYLLPDAFKIVVSILNLAKIENVAAIFLNSNIYAKDDMIVTKFKWLRYVSINAPAFITGVIWKADVWCQYKYYNYPSYLSLPQLDCFIESCCQKKVLLSNQVIFGITHAESSSDINYWFMPRHALVDCFEYPLLYKKVLESNEIDVWTRTIIYVRRIFLLREIYKKMLVFYYCKVFYNEIFPLFDKIHSSYFYGRVILSIKSLVFNTVLGVFLAKRYCSNKQGLQELVKSKRVLELDGDF